MPEPITVIDNPQIPHSSLTYSTSNNESNKRKENNTFSKPRNLDPDFIGFQSIVFLVEGKWTIVLNKIPILLSIEDDPKIYSEAVASKDIGLWKEVINDEMDSILSSNTWILVYLPLKSKHIWCRWVFKKNMI